MKITKLKLSCLFIISLISLYSASGQSLNFNRTYDEYVDAVFCIKADTTTYNIIRMTGYPLFPKSLYFTTLDDLGSIVTEKKYGGNFERLSTYSLVKQGNNNFCFGGYCFNGLTNKYQCKIFFSDLNGDSINSSVYTDTSGRDIYINTLLCLNDNSIVGTGQITDTSGQNGDILLIKFDSSGSFVWSTSMGGQLFDAGSSSIELNDKSIMTIGWTRSYGFGNQNNRDLILVKWDSLGNKLWHRTYGSINFDGANGISPTHDGNYLIAGYKGVPGVQTRCWIMKVDTAGNVLWENTYDDGSGELWWAKERFDGTIVAAGSSDDNAIPFDDGYIVKTDSSGNLQWDRLFNVNGNHSYFRDFDFTDDGGYICAGFVFTGASGNQDAWLVKLDSLGCDSAGCAAYVGQAETQIYDDDGILLFPNPAREVLNVKFDLPYNSTISWNIYNVEGQKVKAWRTWMQNLTRIDIIDLIPGIYLIELQTDAGIFRRKFIKANP